MSEPQQPQVPIIGQVTHYSIELIWEPTLSPEQFKTSTVPSGESLKYVVQEEEVSRTGTYGSGFGTVYSGYKKSHIFPGLEPNTLYRFRIRAMNPYGLSPWSPIVEVSTGKQPPSSEDLHRAVQIGEMKKVKRLVTELHRDLLDAPDKYGYSPLMSAAQKGRTDIAEILIDSGSDVNYQNPSGKTGLMIACFAGQIEVAKLFQKKKVDFNTKDKTGSTAMHWAVDGKNLELVHWLIGAGCPVDAKDYTSGWTPLMRLAATNGDTNVAKALILHGADVNSMDHDRKTVLMVAALNGYSDLVNLLVERGANISIRSSHGKTATDFARAFDHKEIQHFLERKLRGGSDLDE